MKKNNSFGILIEWFPISVVSSYYLMSSFFVDNLRENGISFLILIVCFLFLLFYLMETLVFKKFRETRALKLPDNFWIISLVPLAALGGIWLFDKDGLMLLSFVILAIIRQVLLSLKGID